jgi:ribosomal protein S18 acetylase RimI-like enzyme
VISISRYENSLGVANGMRPINLRTDLAPLADLIELVFADNMDSGGRAALREMRYLSRIGPGLRVLSRINDLALGINMGYVWVADGQLVGNVSIYDSTHWPRELGKPWIIANVGVHPEYQNRGIGRRLMLASMNFIRQRGGTAAILQVDVDNNAARHLYRSLGFVEERAWITWRRSSSIRLPPEKPEAETVFISRRRHKEWKDEMALARRIRPQSQGGLGWLRPLHIHRFRRPFWQIAGDWLSLRGMERLVIRSSDDDSRLVASMWIESTFAGKTDLTLLVDPLFQGIYDDALIGTAVRRFGRSPLVIEQPSDETATAEVLERYRFVRQRSVMHMRWDVT